MQDLPYNIEVGMKVFDSHHHAIGKVAEFKFPENAIDPDIEPADIDGTDKYRDDSLVDEIAKAFGREELPEVLRDRLLREGYIRIDTSGIFSADRLALPSQIASAGADELMLNVDKDELIKRN
ncbi:MAG TPA: hypothetical protein VG757_11755 [Devosia sp.]|nr:hypothetical protein [Devosia sp.]